MYDILFDASKHFAVSAWALDDIAIIVWAPGGSPGFGGKDSWFETAAGHPLNFMQGVILSEHTLCSRNICSTAALFSKSRP